MQKFRKTTADEWLTHEFVDAGRAFKKNSLNPLITNIKSAIPQLLTTEVPPVRRLDGMLNFYYREAA